MCRHVQVYWWNEKYRPRKPKYFNRVHTGYEWNKYNQTHYDHDNPPPKVVQGYKFNIFYPDLIDKDEAPTYSCEKVKQQNGVIFWLFFSACLDAPPCHVVPCASSNVLYFGGFCCKAVCVLASIPSRGQPAWQAR